MSQQRRYSFEFFPTKTDAGHEKLMTVARQLASYKPDFFSCTYGAGGSTRDRTLNTVLQLDEAPRADAGRYDSLRAEQQALAKWGLNFVIEEYLPRKMKDPKSFLP